MLFLMIQYLSNDAPKELRKSWKDQDVASCCAIVNIRLSERGSKLVADSKNLGNHWVCVHFKFQPNLWVCADTLQCLENLK